ncbi:CDP-glucose 4,6-dehydratase [Clostridium ganghwense]|uniref:CDP-glucose 4,6-dehydratase n=1 Tax=Clostridium ganghwense TaxID=312089 RepID=A0ABT4CNA0_9CLOT|nr:CDP-glucose 4,6-dehydratase [Clostridium ganghwense]MCY6370535.1 CDP-glucose 4,6-dehydratase [Clostridium ganghwense]
MSNIFKDIYKNKNVLVTGHTGFKGSWLSIWLRELGANVIGYALAPNSQEDNFVMAGLNKKIIDIRGDVRDLNKLKAIFEKYKPDIVFHLAAQPLVRLSYKIPIETYEVNVMGTLNVLECIRQSNTVKAGIMVTTDKCYENREQIWGYREDDPMGGYDPYSSSKACAEILIASFRNSFINPKNYEEHRKAIASVRAGNVIGGGDWAKDRIVPDCIRALTSNKPIEIRNPKAIRPFQHVLEPLKGYLILAANMYKDGTKYCGGWNFGPDYNSIVNVETVANIILQQWGGNGCIKLSKENKLHEANTLTLDCTKAKTYLGWIPKLNIYESLKYTVEWYRNYKKRDVYDLCLNQIKQYEKL